MSSIPIKVLVGSTNPVKTTASVKAFTKAFPDYIIHCEQLNAPSDVSAQPMTEEETKLGAQNRAKYCKNADTQQAYNFYVAMEGGVDEFEEGPATFAYITVCDHTGRMVTGRTANLPLPRFVYQRLQQGEELASVMDDVFNQHNIRQKGGAIGVLTNHIETRESIYMQSLILTLAPFLHEKLFDESTA